MKPFFPAVFTTLNSAYTQRHFTDDFVDQPLAADMRETCLGTLPKQRRFIAELGMIASLATLDRMEKLLSNPLSTIRQFEELGKELNGRLNDELFGSLFFSLNPLEAAHYIDPTKDWELVIKTWPKTQIDIEESSKCFAFGRHAAAIFHALLVAELGVIEVATLVGVAGDKPGWGALDRLEKVIDKPYKERTPQEQQHFELLRQVLPLMLAMKDSWRHKISHVENRLQWLDTDFSSQLAEEIMKTVRGFMRRLATELAPKT